MRRPGRRKAGGDQTPPPHPGHRGAPDGALPDAHDGASASLPSDHPRGRCWCPRLLGRSIRRSDCASCDAQHGASRRAVRVARVPGAIPVFVRRVRRVVLSTITLACRRGGVSSKRSTSRCAGRRVVSRLVVRRWPIIVPDEGGHQEAIKRPSRGPSEAIESHTARMAAHSLLGAYLGAYLGPYLVARHAGSHRNTLGVCA